ncbi:DUF2115 family protein [uncultured Methanosphaera sp.]|jgi:uncharacterized protein (UPF0305 family)|uniref:DUF2115 family protein n=1 Tax=uncultured Methanosphaera sp. TaxID=262501 RepID=UPI000DC25A06|nr:DUF2115 family protein [uncultured Methanosphaera sp.]RAP44140.1 MAG: hypothetical protein BZ134_04080 [Methanosphaera sp. SHI1033]
MEKVKAGLEKNKLKEMLQNELKNVTLEELYELSFQFNEDTRYLPREYKKKYTESVLNVIISRFAMLKNTKINFEGQITEKEAKEINELLDDNDELVGHILNVIVVYTTYLKHRPVHLPGTVFPGMVSIYTDGEKYYCPVKKYNIDNEKAVCRYCIAVIPDE